jgi:ribosomal protein L11 methyltransferase
MAKEIMPLLSSLHRVGLASDPEMAVVEVKPEQVTPFRPYHIGQRFVLIASDAPDPPLSNDEIRLKFGTSLAFGSGFHPATSLCLQLLERHVLPSMQALDLGAGTGILSVAMAKLGAEVLALDNDPIAVQTAQTAIQLNGVASQVTVQQGSLGQGSDLGHWMGNDLSGTVSKIQPTAAFDLIVANILARVHVALARDYQLALRRTPSSTGLLITGGFTTDQEEDVNVALNEAGFVAIDCQRSNEWVALAHQLVA